MSHNKTTTYGVKIVHINSQVHPRETAPRTIASRLHGVLDRPSLAAKGKSITPVLLTVATSSLAHHLVAGPISAEPYQSFVRASFLISKANFIFSLSRHPSQRLRLYRRIYLGVNHNKSQQAKVRATLL
jgi:hypothetical protein